jgi:predicted site-specific integrase-resolvase
MELTSKQFAERAGVSPQRVRQWVAEGRIVARLLSPRFQLIDSAELAKVKNRATGRPTKKKGKR